MADSGLSAPTGARFSFALTTKTLARVKASVDKRSSIHALTYLHAETRVTALRLTGTDLTTTVRVSVPATVENAGAVCVPIGPFADAVKGAGKSPAYLSVAPNFGVTFAGAVRTTISGMSAAEFPAVREPEGTAVLSMDAGDLRAAMERVSASMSCDATRPHLSALLVERRAGTLRLVATDGHRLHRVERESAGADFRVLIPANAILQTVRMLGAVKGTAELRYATATREVETYVDGGRRVKGVETYAEIAWVSVGDDWVSAKLVDEKEYPFPSYEQVIPACYDREAVVPTVPFRAAVTACAKVASDRTAAIALRFQGDADTLVVSAENPEVGEAKSEPIDVDYSGTDITLGFNARYLIDGLAAVESDTVLLRLSGELDPGTIVDGDLTVVAMPCKL